MIRRCIVVLADLQGRTLKSLPLDVSVCSKAEYATPTLSNFSQAGFPSSLVAEISSIPFDYPPRLTYPLISARKLSIALLPFGFGTAGGGDGSLNIDRGTWTLDGFSRVQRKS